MESRAWRSRPPLWREAGGRAWRARRRQQYRTRLSPVRHSHCLSVSSPSGASSMRPQDVIQHTAYACCRIAAVERLPSTLVSLRYHATRIFCSVAGNQCLSEVFECHLSAPSEYASERPNPCARHEMTEAAHLSPLLHVRSEGPLGAKMCPPPPHLEHHPVRNEGQLRIVFSRFLLVHPSQPPRHCPRLQFVNGFGLLRRRVFRTSEDANANCIPTATAEVQCGSHIGRASQRLPPIFDTAFLPSRTIQ
ncbi:hypothetical protein LXA43DRAFT_581316 [Ganoderma leucocontextum]|nr:hypothetical protein LXA43DRAFT_581316 [Ganoderma leucocontextum]